MTGVYWQDIAPKRLREGFDPDCDVPQYDWLADFGFSGIAYALREHHDLTPRQFFVDIVGLEADSREFEWELNHRPTIDALEGHLRSLPTLGKRADSTSRRIEHA